jgi:hypothetical protein
MLMQLQIKKSECSLSFDSQIFYRKEPFLSYLIHVERLIFTIDTTKKLIYSITSIISCFLKSESFLLTRYWVITPQTADRIPMLVK